MLKQLQSNKLAQMLTALNAGPNEMQQQINSKKNSTPMSKVQSPKNQTAYN